MTTVNMKRQAAYIKDGGDKCPICGNVCIEGLAGFESDSHEAWREIECNNCGSRWHEVYQLSGYEILQVGEKHELKERGNGSGK